MARHEEYYRALGLEPGATPEQVKRAYRDLALLWHPDRYAGRPDLLATAEQKMREINAAYAALQSTGRARNADGPRGRKSTETVRTDARASRSDSREPQGSHRVVLPERSWQGPVAITGVALSPDGTTAWAGGCGLRAWDSGSGLERREFRIERGYVSGLCASPCGRYLACGYRVTVFGAAERREARVCDADSGRERARLKGLSGRLTAAAFSPDGEQIVAGDANGGLSLCDSATGRLRCHFPASDPAAVAERVEFCAGSSRIVSLRRADLQEQIALWDAETGRLIREFTTHIRDSRHYGQIQDVAPSHDSRTLLVANNDPLRHAWTLHLWDMAADRELMTFAGHESRITHVACSPHGKSILSASEDRTVRLWDTTTGAELYRLMGAARGIETATFSADGRAVLGGAADHQVYLWRLPETGPYRSG